MHKLEFFGCGELKYVNEQKSIINDNIFKFSSFLFCSEYYKLQFQNILKLNILGAFRK